MRKLMTGIVLIIVLILIVGLVIKIRDDRVIARDNKLRESYTDSLKVDDIKSTLDTVTKIAKPDYRDNFAAANIADRWVGDNELHKAPPTLRNEVIDRYVRVIDQIAEQPRVPDDAPFMVGQINDFLINNFRIIPGPEAFGINRGVDLLQTRTTHQRMQDAKEIADNKQEYVAEYLAQQITNTSDTQNVHDGSVNKNIKDSLVVLKSTTTEMKDERAVYDEVARRIAASDLSPDRKTAALECLTRLSGEKHSEYGMSDRDILALVWSRASVPMNERVEDKIKDAVVAALADSNGVCLGGRCVRIVESLTTLDYNTDIGNSCTTEQYKNDVMEKAKKLFDAEINRYRDSMDSDHRLLAESYTNTDPTKTIEVKEDVEGEFKRGVCSQIDNMIDEYVEKLPTHLISKLRADAKAAIV
jgi:hypothetical protein